MQQLTRRSVASGMAWAVPAVTAAAVVPAFAASKPQVSYRFAGSYEAQYGYVQSGSCGYSGGALEFLGVDNVSPLDGAPSGFAIIPELDSAGSPSPRAQVHELRSTLVYAFRQGLVALDSLGEPRFTFSSGQQWWSKPLRTTTYVAGVLHDVFEFTWQGATSGWTNRPGDGDTPWPNSNTLVGSFEVNVWKCVGARERYHFRTEASYRTDNGVDFELDSGWLEEQMVTVSS